MTARKWKLIIAELGASAPPKETTVEADNWMEALGAGRQALGETGRVPPGATCTVAPEGHVTILDPTSRRRLTLTEEPAPSSVEVSKTTRKRSRKPAGAKTKTAQEKTAPKNTSVEAKKRELAAAAADRRAVFRTVAFELQRERSKSGQQVVVGEAGPRERAKKFRTAAYSTEDASRGSASEIAVGEASPKERAGKFQTVAYVREAGSSDSAPEVLVPGTREMKPAGASGNGEAGAGAETGVRPAPEKPATTQTTADSGRASHPAASSAASPTPDARAVAVELETMLERDEHPSDENPLTYLERVYVVSPESSLQAVETALRVRLAELQQQHEGAATGKFFNLAAFDHRWWDRPKRPPLAILQWKDWRGDPQVTFPLADSGNASDTPSERPDSDSLADAFEALHDLSFLSTPAEGLEFIVRLLGEAIPCEAQSAFLFDIDTDELRFVAGTGPEAEQRKAQAVPLAGGLLAQAARSEDKTTVVEQLEGTNYDPDIDGRPGLEAKNMLIRPLTHDGHLLGMLQLTNRIGQKRFSRQDLNLLRYVADQLTEFIKATRLQMEKRD